MKYWWYKCEGGKGMVPTEEPAYFLQGRYLHDDLSGFPEGKTADEIIEDLIPLTSEILGRGDQIEMEYHWRRLGWIVAFGEIIWPYLMTHFTVEKFEWEIILQRDPLWIAVKPDLIVRSKATKKLVYIEYKSTSTIKGSFATHWPYASQLHLGLKAASEELGEALDYAHVIGLYKGNEDYGKLNHPFVWGYYNEAAGQWSAEYQRAPGWEKRPVWEFAGGIQQWVREICTEEIRRKQFVWSEPVYLDDRQLIHIVERRKFRQAEIESVKAACQGDELLRNTYFEKRTTHCKPIWGSECPYLAACFNRSVGEKPLESGLYAPRTPHHEVEMIGGGE